MLYTGKMECDRYKIVNANVVLTRVFCIDIDTEMNGMGSQN